MTGSFRLSPDGIYRCDAFQHFVWQEHGFGTRDSNPKADITLRQVHSARVVNANGLRDRHQEGDALITDQIGKSIGVRTADCVPILLLDSRQRAIAAVHAGWRGSAGAIVKHAVGQMRETFDTHARHVYAALGPCIRECCYEVGREVAEKFSAMFPEWEREDRTTRHLDLPKVNRHLLLQTGVPEDQIFDSGLCTACLSAQFFSYRREPDNPGRMVSAIARLS